MFLKSANPFLALDALTSSWAAATNLIGEWLFYFGVLSETDIAALQRRSSAAFLSFYQQVKDSFLQQGVPEEAEAAEVLASKLNSYIGVHRAFRNRQGSFLALLDFLDERDGLASGAYLKNPEPSVQNATALVVVEAMQFVMACMGKLEKGDRFD